jgi:hypothetical protein
LKGDADVIKCDSCGWENPLHAAFCTNCGSELDRAEMSISTDMSGSDELSLDGSDSNSILEAAKKSAQQQRADAEASKPAQGNGADDAVAPEVSVVSNDEVEGDIGGRATLQLNPDQDADEDETAKPVDNDEALKADDADASTGDHELTQDAGANSESGEKSSASVPTASNEEPSNKVGLLAAQTNEADLAADEEINESENGSGASDDRIAYVAFDDGIPDEDEMPDMSMQSIDVGVESLSMDDSLHLGGLHAEEMGREQVEPEVVRDTVEGTVADSLKSVRLRVFTDESPDGALVDVPERGLILGRTSDASIRLSDTCISPKHCELTFADGGVHLTDLGSTNGTWVKIKDTKALVVNAQIRLGRQCFTVTRQARRTSEGLTTEDGTVQWQSGEPDSEWCLTNSARLSIPVPESGLRLGRLSGTLLFEYDLSLSSVHAVLVPAGEHLHFKDFNSRTGSWVRLDGTIVLNYGSEFLLGDSRFQLELA